MEEELEMSRKFAVAETFREENPWEHNPHDIVEYMVSEGGPFADLSYDQVVDVLLEFDIASIEANQYKGWDDEDEIEEDETPCIACILIDMIERIESLEDHVYNKEEK